MSPDVHLGRPYSFEADLHSLGVTLYSMLTGRLPFGDGAQSRDEILEAVLCQQLTFQPEDAVSSEARDLLSQLLRRDSKKPALLEDIMCHPWFYSIRWDQIRAQTSSPRWKPHLNPHPKNTSVCTITEGVPCSPDPFPDFTYFSPEFIALRSREKSIWKKMGAFFSGAGDQSPTPATPPGSPVQSLPTPDISPEVSVPSSPPNLNLPPLPIRKTADPMLLALLSSPGPTQLHSPGAGGVLPPLIIRQQLARRAPTTAKARNIDESLTRTPQLTITPPDSEDEIQEVESCASPLRPPFTEVFDQQLLSPMDAERPTFNPVKVGPRIKLSAPPKRPKRAQKENATVDSSTVTPPRAPQIRPQVGPEITVALHPAVTSKPVVSRSPPTAVFMIPPKVVPLPIVLPNSSPIRTPPQATSKPKTMAKPSSRTSPPKCAPPKVKPAPKVSSKASDPRSKQPQATVRRRTGSVVTRTPASLPSVRSPNFANAREGTYPRALVREKTLSHPALAFVDAKERPQDYPRPPHVIQVKSASMNEPSIRPPPISRPGLEEIPKNAIIVSVDCTRSSSKNVQVTSLSAPEPPSLVTGGPGFDGHLIMSSPTGFNDWRSFFARISTALRCIFSWVRPRGAATLNHL
ncbi:hypothetical protein C0992_002262 [Termitomyces sp. T32_za158]|nr:hypothetical protein C0992_002262 [Termitomyces sp. T32_za158]